MLHRLNRRTHILIVFLRDSVKLYCKNLPSIAICVMFSGFVLFALFETSCVVETQNYLFISFKENTEPASNSNSK